MMLYKTVHIDRLVDHIEDAQSDALKFPQVSRIGGQAPYFEEA